MIYQANYNSPLGKMLIAADDEGIIGLWFKNQKYYADTIDTESTFAENKIIKSTIKWLDVYFTEKKPNFTPPLHMIGSDFRKRVWNILLDIPYGKTMTYGDIAIKIAMDKKIKKMSARAVGGAVGHNPISIIIPCHRVVGSGGKLTGYAGGIDKKIKLLEIEKSRCKK